MLPLGISILKASSDDIPQIIALEEASWLDTYPNERLGITQEDIKARFNDGFKKTRYEELEKDVLDTTNNLLLLVAKKDGHVVGYCRGLKSQDHNDSVELYVSAEYRDRGIGNALWQKRFTWFDQNKYTILEVAEYNANAIRFHEQHGFIQDQSLKQPTYENWHILPNGKKIPVVIMVRKKECI